MDTTKLFEEITRNNNNRDTAILAPFACPNRAGLRRFEEKPRSGMGSMRPVFFRDTDRIMHSLAYARYVDKTQVFSLMENDHITHRSLHVQIVSRIGRVIGRALQLNEDLIEAIALGHDIGHTPFGHEGENVLNDICIEQGIGFFRHNAQSVRCLMELEKRGEGLNLALQVFDGILCHNGEMVQNNYTPIYKKTWDSFLEQYARCFSDADGQENLIPMTLEGCVVRISDVIGYIGRDIEDAIRIGLLQRNTLPKSITKILGENNDDIINTLVTDLVVNSFGKESLTLSRDVYTALRDLKQFNYENIYKNKKIEKEMTKIDAIFKQLFNLYIEDFSAGQCTTHGLEHFLNGMAPGYREKNTPARIVIDFMAGMTDDFLYDQYYTHFLPRKRKYRID